MVGNLLLNKSNLSLFIVYRPLMSGLSMDLYFYGLVSLFLLGNIFENSKQ